MSKTYDNSSAFTDKSLVNPLLNLALPKELKEDGVSYGRKNNGIFIRKKAPGTIKL